MRIDLLFIIISSFIQAHILHHENAFVAVRPPFYTTAFGNGFQSVVFWKRNLLLSCEGVSNSPLCSRTFFGQAVSLPAPGCCYNT